MKTQKLFAAGLAAGLALQLGSTAMAQEVTDTFSSPVLDQTILDNDLSGVAESMAINMPASIITDVQVTLDIAGIPNAPDAYNGDYYAYLQNGAGLCVLLNRIDNGTGNNPGSGMHITLSDLAAASIQSASQTPNVALNGNYKPANPLDAVFGGMDPNSTWTLFVADESQGGTGELVDWSLQISAVPDHAPTWMLLGFSLGVLGLCFIRQPRLATVKQK